MGEKIGKGQPRKFKDGKHFMDRFNEYIDQCEVKEKLPNVAGFCVFAMMTRETFYKQKDYYSDTYDIINSSLEDGALNNSNVAPTILALYLKNKCGYSDKVESTNQNTNTNVNQNIDMSNLTTEQLKELIRNED